MGNRGRHDKGILSVVQLTGYIKELLDRDPVLQGVVVVGELSNFTHHSSGHMYFSLKDHTASIRAVMFRSANSKLKFQPETGMSVVARGYVSVYERTGSYQLYVQDMQPEGVGSLQFAFEQLKQKLQDEGLFDPAHKQPLPSLPRHIGVVTSPTGAAIRDIINVSQRRFPGVNIVVIPTRVQGEGAASDIARAIAMANRFGKLDVLIVGRGGGSLEDLWAFNEEIVARAIFDSAIPVVSAVGHETDFAIADFVADVHAPTPSAAAELVVPDRDALTQRTSEATLRLKKALLREAARRREHMNRLMASRVFSRPLESINQHRQYTDDLTKRLEHTARQSVERARARWRVAAEKLNALSPLGVLTRGYSLCQKTDGQIVRRADDVTRGERVQVLLAEGLLKCSVVDIRPGSVPRLISTHK